MFTAAFLLSLSCLLQGVGLFRWLLRSWVANLCYVILKSQTSRTLPVSCYVVGGHWLAALLERRVISCYNKTGSQLCLLSNPASVAVTCTSRNCANQSQVSHHGNISDPPRDSSWSHRATDPAFMANGLSVLLVCWSGIAGQLAGSGY